MGRGSTSLFQQEKGILAEMLSPRILADEMIHLGDLLQFTDVGPK